MNATEALMQSAESLGVKLWIEAGELRYRATRPLNDGFKAQLKGHKDEIVKLLTGHPGGPSATTRLILPSWCRNDCLSLESVDLPREGPVPGCLRPGPGIEQWTRLEWLRSCPRRSGGRAQR